MKNNKNLFTELLEGRQGIAILIDPDKVQIGAQFSRLISQINEVNPSYILVGGSTVSQEQMERAIEAIKANSTIPVVIFPGGHEQVNSQADGILFTSLVSGRNPEYLIEQQIKSSRAVFHSNLVSLSTGYLLIDGGSNTAVERVSSTNPIPQTSIAIIEETAMAALLLGMKCIYLDAGSGAKKPVSEEIISKVRSLKAPLIVGGGIRSVEQIRKAHEAGASLVIIGNKIEEDPVFLTELLEYQHNEKIV